MKCNGASTVGKAKVEMSLFSMSFRKAIAMVMKTDQLDQHE